MSKTPRISALLLADPESWSSAKWAIADFLFQDAVRAGEAELWVVPTHAEFEVHIHRWLRDLRAAGTTAKLGDVRVGSFTRVSAGHLPYAAACAQLRAAGRYLAWWDPHTRYARTWLTAAADVLETGQFPIVVPAEQFLALSPETFLYCSADTIEHRFNETPAAQAGRQPTRTLETVRDLFLPSAVAWDRAYSPMWMSVVVPDVPGAILKGDAAETYGTIAGPPRVIAQIAGSALVQAEQTRVFGLRRGASVERAEKFTPSKSLQAFASPVAARAVSAVNAERSDFVPGPLVDTADRHESPESLIRSHRV